MDPKKRDELLCEMIAQVAPLFETDTAAAAEVPAFRVAQTARLLEKVQARIVTADARRKETSAAVSFVFATYNANEQWDAEPRTPECAGASGGGRQSARLVFEQLESRDPPSALPGSDPYIWIESPLSTWEFVKTLPNLVYSCVAVLGRAPQIAVLW